MNQGGINLPGTVGIGAQQENDIQATWETIDDVEVETSRAGIAPMEKPKHAIPTLTHDMLMTSSNERYTETQLMIKAWKDYISERFGRIKARQLGIENEMIEIERDTRMAIQQQQAGMSTKDPNYLSKDRIKDRVEDSPRYKELKLRLQMLQQEEMVIEPRLKALSGDLAIISRAVELRKQEWEENRGQSGQPRSAPQRAPTTRAYPPVPPRMG